MIYLDNAATSCPKPERVIEAVTHTLQEVCANPGRGAYDSALEAGRTLLRGRRAVARLIGARDESRVVFTMNATHSLNLVLKGLLADGGHVVVSSLEHNAVARPLSVLVRHGVRITRVPCSAAGETDPQAVMDSVRSDTKLVALAHASNVLGTLLPVAEVGPALRERGVPLLVDAAQTAGCFSLDVDSMGISFLALPGHKGLLGPQGVGVLYLAPGLDLPTLMEGGAGGDSSRLEPPEELPDRHEAGTPNTPGVAGLTAGIELVLEEGVDQIGLRERSLADRLRGRLAEIDGVRLYGPSPGTPAAPVASIEVVGISSAEVAFILDRAFGIAVRAGLHCAPEAHRVAGTVERGLVRFSIGHATTEAEVDAAVQAVGEIATKALGGP